MPARDDPMPRAVDRSAPLRRGVLRIVAVLTLVVLTAATALGLTVEDLRAAQNEAQDRLLPAVDESQQLLNLFVNQETGERGFLITGDRAFLQPYRVATIALPQVQQDLREHIRQRPAADAALDAVLSAHARWVRETVEPEIAVAESGDLARARDLVAHGSGRQQFDGLRTAGENLQQLLTDAQAGSTARIATLTSRLTWLLVVVLTVLAALLAGLYPALQRLVVAPLRRFALAAEQAGAEPSSPVVVAGPREVVTAAREVERMRRRLVEQVQAAQAAEQALAQRGPAVLALRAALAPTDVLWPGLELASRLDPVEGFLAGDWFDAIALQDGRLALVLGDVAGHGPGPAVFALRLKHLLSAALTARQAPGEALSVTARQLGETGELFATVFVAVVDVTAGHVCYANAGHPAALLVCAEPRSSRQGRRPVPVTLPVTQELSPTGPLLSSLTASLTWSTQTVPFAPGDLLLACTDGLLEARSPAGEQYGAERLRHSLTSALHTTDHDGPDGLTRILRQLVEDVGHYAEGRASDDITVMACRRL